MNGLAGLRSTRSLSSVGVCGGAAARRLACTPPSAAFLGSGSLQLRLQSLAGKAAARHARSQQAASPAPLADPSPPANPKDNVDKIRNAPDSVKRAYLALVRAQGQAACLLAAMAATALLCWGVPILGTVLPAEAAQVLSTGVAPVRAALSALGSGWGLLLVGAWVYHVVSEYWEAKDWFEFKLKEWQ